EHDEAHPFLVYSGDIYTEDLGTQFNIRAFAEEDVMEVVVAEGSVELGGVENRNITPVLLEAYERAVVSESGKTDVSKVGDLSAFIGWTQNKLVFSDTPFKKVMRRLERQYNVECSVSDTALLSQRLTATFQNESL